MSARRITNFYERGGLWLLGQGTLLLAVAVLAVRFHGTAPRRTIASTGAVLLGLGTGVISAGAIALGRNLTPFPKPSKKGQFVRSGIFSLIRHPLYTGVMLASVGWALIWQSRPALFVALALIPFFAAKARREEYWLREKFPEYACYERQVNGFIPRIH